MNRDEGLTAIGLAGRFAFDRQMTTRCPVLVGIALPVTTNAGDPAEDGGAHAEPRTPRSERPAELYT